MARSAPARYCFRFRAPLLWARSHCVPGDPRIERESPPRRGGSAILPSTQGRVLDLAALLPGPGTRHRQRSRLPGWPPVHRSNACRAPGRRDTPGRASGAASCSGLGAGSRASSSGYLSVAGDQPARGDQPLRMPCHGSQRGEGGIRTLGAPVAGRVLYQAELHPHVPRREACRACGPRLATAWRAEPPAFPWELPADLAWLPDNRRLPSN